jgi:hypothetical protein
MQHGHTHTQHKMGHVMGRGYGKTLQRWGLDREPRNGWQLEWK